MFITTKRKTRANSDPDSPNTGRGLLETCNAEERGHGDNTCRIHSWRLATTGRRCRLCIRQADMKKRWRAIREAFATIRCFTRKSSAVAKPASASAARTQWQIAIVRAASPATATEGMQVLVVIDCSQGRLTC